MNDKLEEARMRLVAAACIYGGGTALREKCPQLEDYECFKRTMIDSGVKLKQAAIAYYAAVSDSFATSSPPPAPLSASEPC